MSLTVNHDVWKYQKDNNLNCILNNDINNDTEDDQDVFSQNSSQDQANPNTKWIENLGYHLIKDIKKPVKILGPGKLILKEVKFEDILLKTSGI